MAIAVAVAAVTAGCSAGGSPPAVETSAAPTTRAEQSATSVPAATQTPDPTPTRPAEEPPPPDPTPTAQPNRTTSTSYQSEALAEIGGEYTAVDAEPLRALVDLLSLGATQRDNEWFAIGDSPDGERIALTSADGLDWTRAPGEITGLPDNARGPYQLWSLGTDLVLQGRIVDETAEDWSDLDLVIARSHDGLTWHPFLDDLAAPGIAPYRPYTTALDETRSLFVYLGPAIEANPISRSRSGPATLHVLRAEAGPSERPDRIETPPELLPTKLHESRGQVLVEFASRNFDLRISAIAILRPEFEELLPAPSPLTVGPLRGLVRGATIDFANRASFDLGATWTSFSSPTVTNATYSSFGAIGTKGNSNDGFITRDGIVWVPIWLPSLTIRPLKSTEAGVLILFGPESSDALLAWISWPETGFDDLTFQEQNSLIVERNEALIGVLTHDLQRILYADELRETRTRISCIEETSVADTLVAILDAAITCNLPVLDRYKELFLSDVAQPGISPQSTIDCVVDATDAYTLEQLREDAATAITFTALFAGIGIDHVVACQDTS